MCNLYRMSNSIDEVARFFESIAGKLSVAPAGNAPEQIYPGYPGLVLTGETLSQMNWGFPLQRTGAKGQALKPKPVNNARSEKLSSPFWSSSFHNRRCLIPVSAYAEAEGPKGAMTRTWFSLPSSMPDSELMAVAGLWRDTAEWGPAYTMVMTQASAAVQHVHDRMPVVLSPENWHDWMKGAADDARALCRPWQGTLQITRTDTPWFARRAK